VYRGSLFLEGLGKLKRGRTVAVRAENRMIVSQEKQMHLPKYAIVWPIKRIAHVGGSKSNRGKVIAHFIKYEIFSFNEIEFKIIYFHLDKVCVLQCLAGALKNRHLGAMSIEFQGEWTWKVILEDQGINLSTLDSDYPGVVRICPDDRAARWCGAKEVRLAVVIGNGANRVGHPGIALARGAERRLVRVLSVNEKDPRLGPQLGETK
jgi:hypothetical protein